MKSNIEEKLASLDELKAIIEEKEKKLEDTIMQLMEVDSLWLKTQNELETEKAERLKLIHDSRLSQHSRSKVCLSVSCLSANVILYIIWLVYEDDRYYIVFPIL